MEPLEIGLIALATTLVNKAVETTGEKVTEATLEAALPPLQTAIAQLPQHLLDRIAWLGQRLQGHLPTDSAATPILVAEVVETEAQDPEVAAAMAEVTAALPKLEIKIDQRKQQGIVINEGTAHFHEKIEQSFS